MKRLFTYILALSLLPQITSAAVVVGKTEGTFAVSIMGTATYTIPLTIQKGMSDFKPELTLFYDSKAESGIMGQGWAIKGMHAITKVPKSRYFDGTDQGTAYALDGMRLLETNDANGQIYYRTEHDQGDIITITAAQNDMPTTFKVKANDGSIYKYGSSTGRYINGNNSKWALDYAQDALGNYISYTYDQNGGLYPTSITYGRNIHGTAGVDCVISFTYDNATPKRLTKITCKYNNNIYRSYTFNYADSPSRLISVTEGGTGTSAYAPTTFGWEIPDESSEDNLPRINSITNGLGAIDSIGYGIEPWSEILVVTSRKESTPTESRTTTYSYGDYISYPNYYNGKGFIGYEDITAESSTGIVTVYHANRFDNNQVLIPCSVIQQNANGDEIQEDYHGIRVAYAGGKTYRTTDITDAVYTDDRIHYKYDSYSYTNGVPSSHSSGDAMIDTEDKISNWQSPIDTIYIKILPSQISSSTRGRYWVDGGKEKTTTFERDNYTGLVLKKTEKIKTAEGYKPISTDGYSYNEYGQVTQHWTVAYESTDTLVTTYEYDTYGRLRYEYNPLGQYKTFSYNSYGMLSAVRDFDCLTNTSYTYDGMLRETKKNHPTTIKSTTRRSTSNYGGSVYNITVTETGKAPITTYYDAWDRKVAESHPLATGTIMYTDYQYFPHGKIKFVSFPHKKTESAEGIHYSYDDLLRLTEANDPTNNKTSTWDYDYSEVTSCVDGETIVDDYWTVDLPFRVQDEEYRSSDWVEYHYNIDKNATRVITEFLEEGDNVESYVTNYEYDQYGRLSKKILPNGETKQYEYDANGYLWKTTNGGSTAVTNHDKFGRLISKSWTGPEGDSHTVTYTYNTQQRKRHLVAKEEGDNYTYTYTYDNNGILTGKRYSVTSNSRTESASISIQYNTDKLISRKTCSVASTSITEDFSYKYGTLVADTLNGYPVMRITKQDNWGNPTEEKMFFGTTTRTFDDYGHMLSMNHTGKTPQNYSISESYAYDLQTGNLIERNGIPLSYDNRGRLTGWGDHTYSYDKMGNITNQPLIGEYTYNGFRVEDMEEAEGYTNDDSLSITYYNSIERPKSIKNDNYKAEFFYDGDGNRILMEVYKKIRGQFRLYYKRYYLGTNAEVTIDSLNHREAICYAGDDPETAPAAILIDGYNNPKWPQTKLCQIYRDNTGSALLYEDIETGHWFFNYSPWGVKIKPGNNINFYMPGTGGSSTAYRTYKGYEDLYMFGLMFDKTRLYDPYQGRYLSPNPTIYPMGRAYEFNPYIFSKNNPFRKPESFSKNNPFKKF